MKAIIRNGMINNGIQSCFISESGIKIVFHNNDFADKFALSLNLSGISCEKDANIVTIYNCTKICSLLTKGYLIAKRSNISVVHITVCEDSGTFLFKLS